jgi:hypothetical protein
MRLRWRPDRAIPVVAGATGAAMAGISLLPQGWLGVSSPAGFAEAASRLRITASLIVLGALLLHRSWFWWRRLAGEFVPTIRIPPWPSLKAESGALAAMTALTLGGAILRAFLLDDPIRHEEGFMHVRHVSPPLWEALPRAGEGGFQPLATLLARLAVAQWGSGEWVLRLPAFLAGAALPAAACGVARVCFASRSAGVLAAALAAGSPLLMMYSGIGRGYALAALCFALAATAAAEGTRSANGFWWLACSAASAAGIAATPSLLPGVTGLLGWAALAGWRARNPLLLRQTLAAAFLIAFAAAAVFTPLLILGGFPVLAMDGWTASLPWRAWLPAAGASLRETWQAWHLEWPPGFSWVLWTGAALAVSLGPRRLANAALAGSLAAAGVFWIGLFRAAPEARTWLYLLPLYLSFAAAGWAKLAARLPSRRVSAALLLLICGTGVATMIRVPFAGAARAWPECGSQPGAAEAALFLSQHLQPLDVVIAAAPADWVVQHYLTRQGLASDYVLRPPHPERRLILVAGETEGSVRQTLARRGVAIPPAEFRFVRQFAGTAIWIREPRPALSAIPALN